MSRMDQLITEPAIDPPRVIVYGSPGAGKTTFAADAGAIIIDCEGGAGQFANRTPTLSDWTEIRGWLQDLCEADDDRPVAIDTLDWMMRRVVEHVILDLEEGERDVTSTIGSAHGGFFKARDIVKNIAYTQIIPMLNHIVGTGRPVILLSHAINQELKSPEGYDIRVASPDLEHWMLAVWVEWADAVLYAKAEGSEDGREHMFRATETPNIMAKNRYGITGMHPLTWDAFASQVKVKENGNG